MLGTIILAASLVNGCRLISRALPDQVAEMRSEGALETQEDRARLYLSALASVLLWPADLIYGRKKP